MESTKANPIRLGSFVLGALILFGVGVFWIGKRQFLFTPTYRLTAEFPNVGGLFVGSTVRVGGIQKGSVKQIALPTRPDGKVKVVMDLDAETREVVRKDSRALINSEGLIGDKYVEIVFGSPEAPPVEDGATIDAEPPLQISDLMEKANGLLETAQGAVEGIRDTANSVSSITAKIDGGKGTAGALVNDKSLYTNVNASMAALEEDMQALKQNFFFRGFFKNRGYKNEAEIAKDQIAQLPAAAPLRTFRYDGEKIFDKADTAKLDKGKLLDDAGKFLEQNRFGVAVVAAYSNMKGDSDKKGQLTEARAMVAREYLVKHFKLDDRRVKTIGLGKSSETQGESEIRVVIYPEGTPVPPEVGKSKGK